MQFVFSNPFITFLAAVVMAIVAMMVVSRFFPIQVLAFLERQMDKMDRKAVDRKAKPDQ